jgi:hypothetical protein
MVLDPSNLWFSVTASALHLAQAQTVADLVAAHWDPLGQLPNPRVLQMIIDGMDALRGLRERPAEQVWAVVEKLRAAGGPAVEQVEGDLLQTAP